MSLANKSLSLMKGKLMNLYEDVVAKAESLIGKNVLFYYNVGSMTGRRQGIVTKVETVGDSNYFCNVYVEGYPSPFLWDGIRYTVIG